MADAALASLRENATKLGQRLTENLAEHSRDLGLVDSFAPGATGGSGKYLETASLTPAGVEETKKLLGSRRESERQEGLKRVLAMMVKGMPVTQFFPLMTSLLSPATPLQTRQLVSMYIVHCANIAPEVALLSINAYQKDLSDPNPLVRATALTTLASMQVPDIRSLVSMAISKGVRDTNWYVRRASADAMLSLYESTKDASSLFEPLQVAVNTASPLTIASVLTAWESICPDNWDLIHRNYRKWCKMLMDTEEWGQCAILRTLTRYARTHFTDPDVTELDKDAQLLLRSSEPLLWHINPAVVLSTVRTHYYVGPRSHQSKLVQPLLRLLRHADEIRQATLANIAVLCSRNAPLFRPHLSHFYVSSQRDSPRVKDLKLEILASLVDERNMTIVLDELTSYVYQEQDPTFSARAIDALATCARRIPSIAKECVRTLTGLAASSYSLIVARAVSAIRSLADTMPRTERAKAITRLVTLLYHGRITHAQARADVFFLVGQFSNELDDGDLAHEVVRFAAKSFKTESAVAKEAICTLAAKALVRAEFEQAQDETRLRLLAGLFGYVATLARYDTNYETRDRARFLKGLVDAAQIGTQAEREAARLALAEEEFRRGVSIESITGTSAEAADAATSTTSNVQEGDAVMTVQQVYETLFVPVSMSDKELHDKDDNDDARELGTFALLVPGLAIDRPLPPYPSTATDSSVRDLPPASTGEPNLSSASSTPRSSTPLPAPRNGVVLVPTAAVATTAGQARPRRDLESFYADDGEDGESDEEEESEEESEGEESEEEESDEEEEEEESETEG